MPIAITHSVSPALNDCQLSYLEREPIDLDLARQQHDVYSYILKDFGFEVIELDVNADFPDGTFIEDTAVVVDEMAKVMLTKIYESIAKDHKGLANLHVFYGLGEAVEWLGKDVDQYL